VPRPAVKICGLRQPEQALAIAGLGVEAIGVIAVPSSPRFVEPAARRTLFARLQQAHPDCLGVLVVADPGEADLTALAAGQGHRVLQLHGGETPQRCAELRDRLGVRLWKALRIRRPADLDQAAAYAGAVDALLLDAWVPGQLGGTGQRLPLEWLQGFSAPMPWWLAGGITPEGLAPILAGVQPQGLDVSSGVEDAPGVKNLARVHKLLQALQRAPSPGTA
jgi:phosphoribosylanthranilate isomerase